MKCAQRSVSKGDGRWRCGRFGWERNLDLRYKKRNSKNPFSLGTEKRFSFKSYGQRKSFPSREKNGFFCSKRSTKTFCVPREIFLSKTANENLFRPERNFFVQNGQRKPFPSREKNGFVQNGQRKSFPSREKWFCPKQPTKNFSVPRENGFVQNGQRKSFAFRERNGFVQDAREFFFPSLPREKCFVHNVGQQNSFWKKKRTTSEPGHRPSKPVVYLLFLGRFGQDEKEEGKRNRVVKMATNGTKASVDRKARVQCRNGDRTKDLKREKKEQKATNASIEGGPLLQDGR